MVQQQAQVRFLGADGCNEKNSLSLTRKAKYLFFKGNKRVCCLWYKLCLLYG